MQKESNDWINSLITTFRSYSAPVQACIAFVGVTKLLIVSYGTYLWYNYTSLYAFKGKLLPVPTEKLATKKLRVRVINLDGAMLRQTGLMEEYKPEVIDLHEMGPALRIECSFRSYWAYEKALVKATGKEYDDDPNQQPLITFYGSNDFHHLSLPLIKRFRTPFNLVIFDNHPDWFKYYPGLHCGCWLNHVVSLPTVHQTLHMGGGSGEFEDEWSFHPWDEMKSGKIAVFPTQTLWKKLKHWKDVPQRKLREDWRDPVKESHIREILKPFEEQLKKYPLYITLDKDCMFKPDNYQNWNSGYLTRKETLLIIKILIELSGGKLLAMDVTGEFSKVKVKGYYRTYLHNNSHEDEQNNQSESTALRSNQLTNLELMKMLHEVLEIPDER